MMKEIEGTLKNIEMFTKLVKDADKMTYDVLLDAEQLFRSTEILLSKAKDLYYNGTKD